MEVWDRGTPPLSPACVYRYGVDCGVKQLLLSELGVHFYELLKTRRAGAGDKEAWASLLLALGARCVFNAPPLTISDATVAAAAVGVFGRGMQSSLYDETKLKNVSKVWTLSWYKRQPLYPVGETKRLSKVARSAGGALTAATGARRGGAAARASRPS